MTEHRPHPSQRGTSGAAPDPSLCAASHHQHGAWVGTNRRTGRAVLCAAVGAVLLLASACTAATSGAAASSTSTGSTSTGSTSTPSTSTGTATSTTSAATPATSPSASLTADQPVPKAPANDLAKNSAHRVLAIDGEQFKLKVDYWTTVDSSTWTATGAKDVHLLAYVQAAAGVKPPDVVIDRFSPAITLMAASTGLTGVSAGNVVDPDAGGGATDASGASMGGSGLPGFLITSTVSYGSQFGTAGVSDALATRWQQLAPHETLSEAALQHAGVYAVRVSMTYRLLVRNAGDAGWHRRTVVDTITVPVRSGS